MEANQLIKALGDAAGAAKPPQEYCFLWIDWWATCMTKTEWSGWMQAIGALLAIAVAFAIANWQQIQSHKSDVKLAKALVRTFGGALVSLPMKLPRNGTRSLWDVRLSRLLLEEELGRVASMPMHALNADQQLGFLALRLGALQALEAMKIAESNAGHLGDVALVGADAYAFLMEQIEICSKATNEGLKLFGDAARP